MTVAGTGRGVGTGRVVRTGKLNLFLEVLSRRPDGLHEIETVLVEGGGAEVLEARRTEDPGVTLEMTGLTPATLDGVPRDGTNLAVRAARRVLEESGAGGGIALQLAKSLPAGSGMGGGSADAAAALEAVDGLLGSPLGEARLLELALELGSDVPFLLKGGAALARGRGERLEPVSTGPGLGFLVLHPGVPSSTAEVYGQCRPAEPGDRHEAGAVLEALTMGDPDALGEACFNRLEDPARTTCPAAALALDRLSDLGRRLGRGRAHLTGSGSSCFLLLPEAEVDRVETEGLTDGLPGGARIYRSSLLPDGAVHVR